MRITVHIPDSLENEIKKTSKNEGKSKSSLIAEATKYYLKEKGKRMIGLDTDSDMESYREKGVKIINLYVNAENK